MPREPLLQRMRSKMSVGRARLAFTAVLLLGLAVVWGLLISGRLSAMEVISSSMEPTLLVGDRVLVADNRGGDVERGEIVVVRSQRSDDPFPLIKRVSATPGDFVVVLGNQAFVNRKPTRAEAERLLGHWPPRRSHMYSLAPGQFFVLGDNRANSEDSIYFGPVERDDIIGRAHAIYAPLRRMRAL